MNRLNQASDAVTAAETGATGLDQAVLRALARSPRASFAEVGAQLGVHERTVARRLGRLIDSGQVRFTASLVPEYLHEGVVADVAVACAPGRLHEVATVLARRPDVRTVGVGSGGNQVFAEVCAPDQGQLLAVLDGSIGRIAGVVDLHSAVMLRLLLTAKDWAPDDEEPTATRRRVQAGEPLPQPPPVDELDRALVALLEGDARMSVTRLARELCVGETTARRRLDRLMSSHVLHLRLHAEPGLFGFPVEARFFLAVEHGHLEQALRRLATEPAIRHLAVTTGRANVLGHSSHRSLDELHRFTTHAFAELEGVNQAETSLMLRTYKRVGLLDSPAGRSARRA